MLFTCNTVNAKVRTDRLRGREFLVAPVVAIKGDAVLNGEFVPFEELERGFGSWDGRPVTLGHPQQGEAFISANDPRTLELWQVGDFYRTYLDDGAIKGEAWIDVELAQQTADGRELLRRLRRGEPVEVSTGYWRELDSQGGTYNGQDYEGVARDLKPDHLAMLLNETGACSWADGCGAPRVNQETFRAPESARNNAKRVLRWREEHPDEIRGMTRVGWARANQLANNEPLSLDTVCRMAAFARHEENAEVAAEFEGEPWRDAGYVAWLGWGGNWAQRTCEANRRDNVKVDAANLLSEARTPSYNGTTSEEWSAPDLEDYNFGIDTVEELTEAQRNQIARGSLLGDPEAETFGELSFFPVVEPGGALNENALMAVISGRGQQADIPQATYESAEAVARRLLEDEFDMGEEENVSVNAVVRILRALGLRPNHAVTNEEHGNTEGDMEVQEFRTLGEEYGVSFTDNELDALTALPHGVVNKLTSLIEALAGSAGGGMEEEEPPMANACTALTEAAEAVGGPEKAAEILVNARRERAEKRQGWLEAIVANSDMETEALGVLPDDVIEQLAAQAVQRNARTPDYSGRGMANKLEVNTTEGVHEYKRPDPFGREEGE
jgi:hypothetical protein